MLGQTRRAPRRSRSQLTCQASSQDLTAVYQSAIEVATSRCFDDRCSPGRLVPQPTDSLTVGSPGGSQMSAATRNGSATVIGSPTHGEEAMGFKVTLLKGDTENVDADRYQEQGDW